MRLNASTVALLARDTGSATVSLYRISNCSDGDILDLSTAYTKILSARTLPIAGSTNLSTVAPDTSFPRILLNHATSLVSEPLNLIVVGMGVSQMPTSAHATIEVVTNGLPGGGVDRLLLQLTNSTAVGSVTQTTISSGVAAGTTFVIPSGCRFVVFIPPTTAAGPWNVSGTSGGTTLTGLALTSNEPAFLPLSTAAGSTFVVMTSWASSNTPFRILAY